MIDEILTIEFLVLLFISLILMYIPLHGHSTFSFLEAVASPSKICKRAKELGMPAIAITDFGGMYGLPAFTQAAKDAEMKAILGVELGFVLDLNSNMIGKQIGNITLLAQTLEGYQNLMRLTSFANQTGIHIKPKIDLDQFRKNNEGIIALYGGTESRLGKMLQSGENHDKIYEIHEMIHEILGDRLYLEIIAQEERDNNALFEANQLCLSFSNKSGIQCVINNEYFYPEPEDHHIWEVALAIKDNMKMYDPTRRQPKGRHHLMTAQEITQIGLDNGYSSEQLTLRLSNNQQVADSITATIKFGNGLFPKYNTPEDIKTIYEANKDSLVV